MTNYEKIKFLLEMGVYKGVRVWFPMNSLGEVDFKEIKSMYDIPGDINKLNITSITPIANPPKLLPVGTKVRVFEEYDDGVFSEEVFTITASNQIGYSLYPLNIVAPSRAVVPVWED